MADTRYLVAAASIVLHPRQLLAPEEIPGVRVPPETEWLVREIHLTRGMPLPPNVNPVDVAQLLEAGLVKAIRPGSEQSLGDALLAWADRNAHLTGRIKELALAESEDADRAGSRREAALTAVIEATGVAESARADVVRAYRRLHLEVPPGFEVGPSD
ncbi:hypothetical protein BWI15_16525 [Kribbella sp. ALI-6-A]|uniref:hypothetical protein n=1 Tax=Kribbella sp. ALI-6-A TaxID=1933817 RepID=UPI00097C8684|nr:hypothetical protein [Kribbella sp. ALI-6-A]ONI71748.1 hypothetical protein BWI15_16525 [Kribbella sp. ALI-6-A]